MLCKSGRHWKNQINHTETCYKYMVQDAYLRVFSSTFKTKKYTKNRLKNTYKWFWIVGTSGDESKCRCKKNCLSQQRFEMLNVLCRMKTELYCLANCCDESIIVRNKISTVRAGGEQEKRDLVTEGEGEKKFWNDISSFYSSSCCCIICVRSIVLTTVVSLLD